MIPRALKTLAVRWWRDLTVALVVAGAWEVLQFLPGVPSMAEVVAWVRGRPDGTLIALSVFAALIILSVVAAAERVNKDLIAADVARATRDSEEAKRQQEALKRQENLDAAMKNLVYRLVDALDLRDQVERLDRESRIEADEFSIIHRRFQDEGQVDAWHFNRALSRYRGAERFRDFAQPAGITEERWPEHAAGAMTQRLVESTSLGEVEGFHAHMRDLQLTLRSSLLNRLRDTLQLATARTN